MDFREIEERYDGPGNPAYHPKIMMKLLVQGVIDGILSSMGMVKLGHLSIDGTKIRASASNFSVLSK